jgi:hypothetical protein
MRVFFSLPMAKGLLTLALGARRRVPAVFLRPVRALRAVLAALRARRGLPAAVVETRAFF